MSPQRAAGWLLVIFSAAIMGCTGDSTEYKQKIMELEKRIQKQEGELRDFAGKFAPPKDFSADIQRLEDQQERISEVLKTRVEPVNAKMEEFRDWAQDAQKDREAVAKRLKTLEQSMADAQKRIESEDKESAKLVKELATQRKAVQALLKNNDEFGKNIAEIKKELQDNNEKIINAVKKTLPKVKEAAVAEIKGQIEPIEHALGAMKTGIENDRKAIAAMRAQALSTQMENPKDVQLIARKIKDLEEALTTQKSYLLEVGTKIHELESGLRRGSDVSQAPPGPARRRWEANRSE